MTRSFALLAAVAGLITSSLGTPTVEKRQLLPPSITQIISTLTSIGLIKDINVFITPQSLVDNTVSLNFDVQNTLPIEFTIDSLGTDAGLNSTVYATFSHTFPSPGLVVPALGTVNSGTIDGVTLPQGALATLGIIPFGELDLSDLSASTRQITISGAGGIPLPLSGLAESSVPTVYSPTPAEIANSLSLGLVKGINVVLSLQSLVTNTVSLNFDVQNTIPFEITIDQLGTDAGLNGTTFLTFQHSFPSPGLIVPALGSANSGNIDGVTLPQGALATFGIIPSQKLDLSSLTTSIRALTISGSGGIPIPLSGLSQSSVPTT
ncbi:hypothetical protein BDN70DRAFT_691519 [Pholiota conissans]|uniref:Uncharacterized protein n=1 Tax=Pholiota conissans TaxID=109636 RepID=A0A9P5Z0Z5_9AGAR|nr:hypothetical protein BDN70DRAFT_691519 [Pholiota conissans]